MATLYEYWNIGDIDGASFDRGDWFAQTFSPSIAHKITSVKLLLYREGLPGTLTVSIRATDGNGHPTGGDLCSGTTNGNTLPTSSPYEWREITLGAGYDLVADTKYAIVARALEGDRDNQVYWRVDASAPVYAKGAAAFSENSGSEWFLDDSVTFMFEDLGELPPVTYYHGLKVQGEGELALCDVGSHPLRIRKGGTTYGIPLVDTSDPNASAIRKKTGAGVKAIRKYTE